MRGGKGSAVTTALIVVLVLAVGGMACYIFMSRNAAPQPEEQQKRSYVITSENAEEIIQQEKARPKAVASYTAQMNSTWHFPNGQSPSTDAYVANSSDNVCDVWFSVTLNNGRTVYESPILPPDTYIRNFALTEALEPGTYGATVTYHLVDEEQTELTTLSFGVSIIVEG